MDLHQLQFQQQQQESKNSRNLYAINGQISPSLAIYNPTHVQDHSQHPPYIPPFHVVGFAPGPGQGPALGTMADGSDAGLDLQWNPDFVESKKKRLKEQDFLENNSQLSSLDFLNSRPVSTGLGLSLDNTHNSSSSDSVLFSLIGDEVDRELQHQNMEIDRFLKIQGDRLRQAILEKVQADQLHTLSLLEDKVVQKLHEKEAEAESMSRKNLELEERVEQLSIEAGAWQQRAKYNENMISVLRFNLQQIHAQSRDSKEGCGDSEVDDTASCYNGKAIDFHLLRKDNKELVDLKCKFCRVNEVCILLLPCKHLCLCKDCDSKLNFCPLCQSSKYIGMEVYM